jgi:hypothetical protein
MNATGKIGALYEAKILLPLKNFAYGVPPHTFINYFQMSKGLAARSCDVFALSMKLLYNEEYLRSPDALDLKRNAKFYKECHGVNGMFGSLDYMHTPWKNGPKGCHCNLIVFLLLCCHDFNLIWDGAFSRTNIPEGRAYCGSGDGSRWRVSITCGLIVVILYLLHHHQRHILLSTGHVHCRHLYPLAMYLHPQLILLQ